MIEKWMESRFGLPAKKKYTDVDMNELMAKAAVASYVWAACVSVAAVFCQANLQEHFGVELWPGKAAVVELATQLQKCKFVASDLHKFLPSYCKGHAPVVLDDEQVPPWMAEKASPREGHQ